MKHLGLAYVHSKHTRREKGTSHCGSAEMLREDQDTQTANIKGSSVLNCLCGLPQMYVHNTIA
jgi:hypothetical protein